MAKPIPRVRLETVYLDKLDGAGFERLCCSILERAGWGRTQATGGVADGGFGIIVHGGGGKMIVECRHPQQSSVGRSIVQRLHSAVISEKAARGVIITTGRYAREASDYAEKLPRSAPIHLYDRPGLDILAARAGIALVPYARPTALTVIEHQAKINDAMNQLADRLKRDGKYVGYKTMRHQGGPLMPHYTGLSNVVSGGHIWSLRAVGIGTPLVPRGVRGNWIKYYVLSVRSTFRWTTCHLIA